MPKLALVAALALAVVGCFVDGRTITGPDDPQYTALCVDSTLVDSTQVCIDDLAIGSVHIVIPNPTLPDSGGSQHP